MLKKTIKLTICILILLVLSSLTFSGDIEKTIEPIKSFEPNKIADTRGWDIIKNGTEESLDVDYTILSDTMSEFCIKFNDKEKYVNDLSKVSKDINNIPVTKIDAKQEFTLEKSSLDLSKISKPEDKECFNVNYPEFIEGMQFKIGEESVLINSSASFLIATEDVGKNIYVDIYGCRNVGYIDFSNDVYFARSCDGLTWITKTVLEGTFYDVGITGNSTGGLLEYWSDSSDIDGRTSNDNGTTWSATTTLIDRTFSVFSPSCGTDKGDKFHCCAIDTTGYDVYYSNSTNWNTEKLIYNGETASPSCALEVGPIDNCIYVAVTNINTDIAVILKSCGGWGSTTIYDDEAFNIPTTLSIANISGTQSYFVGIRNDTANQFDACFNTAGSWACSQVNTTNEFNGVGAMNNRGQTIVLSESTTGYGGMTNISNSSNYGTTWATTGLNGMSDFPSIADQTFPVTAKMDNIAHIVYTNSSGVYYNYSVIYEPPLDTTPPTLSSKHIIIRKSSSGKSPHLTLMKIINFILRRQ